MQPKSTTTPPIGSHVRTLRKSRGLTLEMLSGQLGLSKGHLSRFERGEKSLSVASLLQLAQVLEVNVATLTGEHVSSKDVTVVPEKERNWRFSETPGNAYRYAHLGGSSTHNSFVIDLEAGKTHEGMAVHAGTELLFVLSGSVKVRLAQENLTLECGGYLEFPGHTTHAIESIGSKASIFIVVI